MNLQEFTDIEVLKKVQAPFTESIKEIDVLSQGAYTTALSNGLHCRFFETFDPEIDELVGVLIMKKNSSAVVKYDEVCKKAREEAKRLFPDQEILQNKALSYIKIKDRELHDQFSKKLTDLLLLFLS